MSTKIFAPNERLIVRLLLERGALSKAELARNGEMSWATVVKMINRLLEFGTIEIAGTADREVKPGKKELLYALSRDAPLAIGIDVEYNFTRLILTNLLGELLAEEEHPTPQNPTVPALSSFLLSRIEQFTTKLGAKLHHVAGIGIGLPGVVIPAWLKPDMNENRKHLEEYLSSSTGIPVKVEINVRAYTNQLKWNNPFFSGEDFMLVSIRTGVGMGIIHQGELFIGHQYISGEIGHMKITEGGRSCRCGGNGCLETEVNQARLYQEYRTLVQGDPDGSTPSREEIEKGLQDLFTRASEGNRPARAVLARAAVSIGKALSYTLMTFFIPNVIICGSFGPHGDAIVPMITKELECSLLPNMAVNIRYLPFERFRYAHGAALLALKDYL